MEKRATVLQSLVLRAVSIAHTTIGKLGGWVTNNSRLLSGSTLSSPCPLTASLLYSAPPLGALGLLSRFAWRGRSLLAGQVGNIVAGRGVSWGWNQRSDKLVSIPQYHSVQQCKQKIEPCNGQHVHRMDISLGMCVVHTRTHAHTP